MVTESRALYTVYRMWPLSWLRRDLIQINVTQKNTQNTMFILN